MFSLVQKYRFDKGFGTFYLLCKGSEHSTLLLPSYKIAHDSWIIFCKMGRGKPLTEYEKGQIDAYKSNGKSNREISQLIRKSANAVNLYVKYKDTHGKKRVQVGRQF